MLSESLPLEGLYQMTFAEEIERAAGGQLIEAIVVGEFGWGLGAFEEDQLKLKTGAERGVKASWGEVRPALDYAYDRGFGAPECDAIFAWTDGPIIFVSTYDGSTSVEWIPRNPADTLPCMFGGG